MRSEQVITEAGTIIGFYDASDELEPLGATEIEEGDLIKFEKAAGDGWKAAKVLVDAATEGMKTRNAAAAERLAAAQKAAKKKRGPVKGTLADAAKQVGPKTPAGKVAAVAVPAAALATLAHANTPAGRERIGRTRAGTRRKYEQSRDVRHYRPASLYYDDYLGKAEEIIKAFRVDSEGKTEKIKAKAARMTSRAEANEAMREAKRRKAHGPRPPARMATSERGFRHVERAAKLLPKSTSGKIALAAGVPATILASRNNFGKAAEEVLSGDIDKGWLSTLVRRGSDAPVEQLVDAAGAARVHPPKHQWAGKPDYGSNVDPEKVFMKPDKTGNATEHAFIPKRRRETLLEGADKVGQGIGSHPELAAGLGVAGAGAAAGIAQGVRLARANRKTSKLTAAAAREAAARKARRIQNTKTAAMVGVPTAVGAKMISDRRNRDVEKGLSGGALDFGVNVAVPALYGASKLVAKRKAAKAAAKEAAEQAARDKRRKRLTIAGATAAVPAVLGVGAAGGALGSKATTIKGGDVEKALDEFSKIAMPKIKWWKSKAKKAAPNPQAHASATKTAHEQNRAATGSGNPVKEAWGKIKSGGGSGNLLQDLQNLGDKAGAASGGLVQTSRNMRGVADNVRRIVGGQHPVGPPGITPAAAGMMAAAGGGGLLLGRQLAGPKPYPYQQQQA